MSWEQFLKKLQDAKLSQRAFSRQTGTDISVVQRWKNRVRGVPRWVELWLANMPKPKKARKAATAR